MIYGLALFFNLLNIVFIGTSIGIFVVSYFIYKPFDEGNYESDTDEDEFYEYKYLEDYYDLLDKKLKLKEEESSVERVESLHGKEEHNEDGEDGEDEDEDKDEDEDEDGDEDEDADDDDDDENDDDDDE